MDKFSQITFDFFNNQPADQPDELKEIQPTEEADQAEQHSEIAAPNTEMESSAHVESIAHNESMDEEQVMPSFLASPSEDLLSLVMEPDNNDIIDFSIIDEKDLEDHALVSKSTRGRKSLKSFDSQSEFPEVPADEVLNQKQYYSIGEVALMFKVNPSLLRFWESEFDIIQPRKNKKGDRHFRPIDIRNLELIYDLLRRRKLTIEGAREYLKKNSRSRERYDLIQSLQKIRAFMLELKTNL